MKTIKNHIWENTTIWKNTLGKNDENAEYVEKLSDSYYAARENTKFLLDKIQKDFPYLTIHNITHVDSLWNVADTIIGPNYKINPLEGYILGIAFLIHDVALSYDAVGGKDKLRETVEWRDAYAEGDGEMNDERFLEGCDFKAIRLRHAKEAERILFQTFKRENGSTFFIIDDDSLRNHYGERIGKIAASHHLDIDNIREFDKQVAMIADMPNEWEINEQKLACILRCADAGHLDNNRAPDNLYFYRSLSLNGESIDHWKAQNRLGKLIEYKKNTSLLLITSTTSFKKETDIAAWNVAYDAIKLFDKELRRSNELLREDELDFPHKGVVGAESRETLAEYVKTDGWKPCDIGVHTSNVKSLIENLGGSKLYGDNNLLLVTLRELLQNARDAIHARRTIDSNYINGRIVIRYKRTENHGWIELEDNGIGMSLDCIKYHLLDFGSSYWKSFLSKSENPGLLSKKFTSVGKFGIGFYSVFMVAKSVEVITRRYNESGKATKVEFPKGLTLSPVMSSDTLSPSISTIVRFELKDEVKISFQTESNHKTNNVIGFSKALSSVAAGLDVDVFYNNSCIHPNVKANNFDKKKWLSGLLLHEPSNIDELSTKIEQITDKYGNMRGLFLPPKWAIKINYTDNPKNIYSKKLLPVINAIGGLSSNLDLTSIYANNGFLGYVDGVEDSISRNKMILDPPLKDCLSRWIKEKYWEDHHEMLSSENSNDLINSHIGIVNYYGYKDEVIQDSIKRYYSEYINNNRYCYSKEKDAIITLISIHRYLTIGILPKSGDMKGVQYQLLKKQPYPIGNNNRNNQNITLKKTQRYRIIERGLKNIAELPESNFEEITKKFINILLYHPFDDVNKRTLGIWINLFLDSKCDNMIDWRKVDYKSMMTLTRNTRNVSDFLKRYLSRTQDYLNDICDSNY